MANNKLILRALNSPWTAPVPDITKNSVLTHADVDNNFIYLKGEVVYSAGFDSGNLVLNKVNGGTVILPIPTGTTDTFVTGGTYDNNTEVITFTNNLNGQFTVDLSTLDINDTFVTGGTVTGTTLTLNRSDGADVPIDVSGIVTTGHTKQFPGNQEHISASITGDTQPTGITLVGQPIAASRVDVIVNGVTYNVGDGVKTTDFYFSPNGGAAVKTLSTLTLGDELIFNGNISGIITLDGNDKININYSVLI